ncbi:MAG: V4R domain-containing protein [Gemmatimonadales bacterium]|nr:V4R domain-containing protein [Gemmatimonadales bacterium]
MTPSAASSPSVGELTVGRGALRQLHASLAAHAPEQAVVVLQETGYAAGEAIYRAFSEWLPGRTGVDRPEELDADLLGDVLSDFFVASGWGAIAMAPVGASALALDAADWAEAEPGSAENPMCFFSAGMLADFLGRLSDRQVSVMEVECRSRGDARCRFLSATPEILGQVYEQMTQGKSYEEALQ